MKRTYCLQLEVTYNGEPKDVLAALDQLERSPEFLVQQGLLTGSSKAELETWNTKVQSGGIGTLNPSLKRDLEKLLDYLWADEDRSFCTTPPEHRRNHIFRVMKRLQAQIK